MKTLMSTLFACAIIFGINSVSAQPKQRTQMTPEQRSERMAERMTERHSLTTDQQKQIYDLHYSVTKDFTPGQGRENMEKTREALADGLKKILTDEQFAKWQEAPHGRHGNMQPRGEREGNRHAGMTRTHRGQNRSGECTCSNDGKKPAPQERGNTTRSERRANRSAQNG